MHMLSVEASFVDNLSRMRSTGHDVYIKRLHLCRDLSPGEAKSCQIHARARVKKIAARTCDDNEPRDFLSSTNVHRARVFCLLGIHKISAQRRDIRYTQASLCTDTRHMQRGRGSVISARWDFG